MISDSLPPASCRPRRMKKQGKVRFGTTVARLAECFPYLSAVSEQQCVVPICATRSLGIYLQLSCNNNCRPTTITINEKPDTLAYSCSAGCGVTSSLFVLTCESDENSDYNLQPYLSERKNCMHFTAPTYSSHASTCGGTSSWWASVSVTF